jgi:hypothetical protein
MTASSWYLSYQNRPSLSRRIAVVRHPSLCGGAYFLPDFLMPWEPVLSGPLPLPTVLARSSRAFLSVSCQRSGAAWLRRFCGGLVSQKKSHRHNVATGPCFCMRFVRYVSLLPCEGILDLLYDFFSSTRVVVCRGGAYEGFWVALQAVEAEYREGYAPAASLALWAMSSSSRSCAFFLGFLL